MMRWRLEYRRAGVLEAWRLAGTFKSRSGAYRMKREAILGESPDAPPLLWRVVPDAPKVGQ